MQNKKQLILFFMLWHTYNNSIFGSKAVCGFARFVPNLACLLFTIDIDAIWPNLSVFF
jgi:hypothetical protein